MSDFQDQPDAAEGREPEGGAGSERIRQQARELAEEAEAVRARVRALLVDGIEAGKLTAEEIERVTDAIVTGALEGVEQKEEAERKRVFEDVVSGLSDGYRTALHATRLAVEEAAGKGRAYAREELEAVGRDLKTLDRVLVKSVKRVFGRGREEVAALGHEVSTHLQRAAEDVRPSLTEAIRTLGERPAHFATGAASAGADAAGRAASGVWGAALGMLEAAAERVRQGAEKRPAGGDDPETGNKDEH